MIDVRYSVLKRIPVIASYLGYVLQVSNNFVGSKLNFKFQYQFLHTAVNGATFSNMKILWRPLLAAKVFN